MTRRGERWHGQALQLGFLALLTICVAQLGYWMRDEWRYTAAARDREETLLASNAQSATALVSSGAAWDRIAKAHPELERAPDGTVRVTDSARAAIGEERFHRLNRYTWEGGFFLVVLLGAMGIVYAAISDERTLRRQQEFFLAAASHELKSPLASLRLSAETLSLRDPGPARRVELVTRILADLGRLQRTIDNILDASRFSGGGVVSARKHLRLSDAVAPVVEEMSAVAAANGVTMTVVVPPTLELFADRESVQTIARNLIDNAIKASRGRAGDATVTVTGRDDAGATVLDVHDRGVGFAPEESRRLFRKFYRIEHAVNERLSGTGLGLYLVRRVAELDGGAVSARSDGPGTGACFTVRWPAPAAHGRGA